MAETVTRMHLTEIARIHRIKNGDFEFDVRPRDVVGLAVASGYFSEELQQAQRNAQLLVRRGVQHYETIIELTSIKTAWR